VHTIQKVLLAPIALAAAACLTTVAYADTDDFAYQQTNLVSDGAVQASTTDGHLKNPWGIAAFPGGPFWISDNGVGVSTLYDGKGDIVPLTVTIPPPTGSAGTPASPTGIVWNPNGQAFLLAPGAAALFIFATEDGTISAWNPTVNRSAAVLKVDNSQGGNGAVYKGLALATNSHGVFLYATNFRNGTVDVFDSTFKPATLPGSFTDHTIPAGYAPFGIALIDGNLFVSYAKQDAAKHDDVAGQGHGFVNVFDTNGHLIRRFASRGALDSPWGMVRAPLDFGGFGAHVLIGNFGDGHISAFNSGGDFRGQLRNASGGRISIDGLWGLIFGTGAAADSNTLYFTAGTNHEADGLFGLLQAVEPVEQVEHHN
jgi:uncharacterized protein (TIGR03118 family)